MNDLAPTAYHEAGHAVATLMRGRSSLRVVSVAASDYRCSTFHRSPGRDDGFVAWAGPWAQAHAEWSDRPLDGADDEFVFDDYFTAAYLSGGLEDSQIVEQHFASLPWHSMRAGTERVWAMELARKWPAIEQVAEWLLVGEPVTDERVRDLTDVNMPTT